VVKVTFTLEYAIGPEGKKRYRSTLSLTLAPDGGYVVNATPQLLYCQERDTVPILQEAGRVPGPVWTSAEKITPTKIQSTDCPAHSKLLY
jgi:hypothetical protein